MTDQTHDSPDARWQRLADADLAGELLTPHERELLATYEATDPHVRAEQRVRRELAALGRDDLVDPDADERTISAAVADFMAAPAGTRPLHVVTPAADDVAPARARRRRASWLAAGVLLAASVALVWGLRAPQREPLTILSGDPIVGEAAAVPGASLAGAAELRADREPACVGSPGRVRACLSPGSRARVLPDGALELLEGQADVTVDLAVTKFVVQVAGVRVTSDAATYTLAVRSGVWSAAARRGTVTLADAAGPLARLGPGDRMTRADPSAADPGAALPTPAPAPSDISPVPSDIPASPVPADTSPVPPDSPDPPGATDSDTAQGAADTGATANIPTAPRKREPPPADLLAQAREHRAAGRVADAARAYERLIKAHPDSPLAGTALLALGQLYLGAAADPRAALRAFDRYLERGGPLAEEAAHGKISALTRLGRKAEARDAIDRFLARYPASSYADTLRRQLDP